MFDGHGKHTTSKATSWFPHHPWPLSLHKCQLSSASSSPQPPWGWPDSSLSLLSTLTHWQIPSALFSGYIQNLTAAHSTAPPSYYLLSPWWSHHSLPGLMASFLVLSLFTTASDGSHSTPSPQPESSFDWPPCPPDLTSGALPLFTLFPLHWLPWCSSSRCCPRAFALAVSASWLSPPSPHPGLHAVELSLWPSPTTDDTTPASPFPYMSSGGSFLFYLSPE